MVRGASCISEDKDGEEEEDRHGWLWESEQRECSRLTAQLQSQEEAREDRGQSSTNK